MLKDLTPFYSTPVYTHWTHFTHIQSSIKYTADISYGLGLPCSQVFFSFSGHELGLKLVRLRHARLRHDVPLRTLVHGLLRGFSYVLCCRLVAHYLEVQQVL